MKRPSIEQILLILTVVVLAIMFLASSSARDKEAARLPSTGSDAPSGVSVFVDLMNRLKPESASSRRRAIFVAEDLAPYSTIYLLAPRRALTTKERDLLLNWIELGGKLVFSFQDEATAEMFKPFLNRAEINAMIGPVPDFKQFEALETKVKSSHAFFRAGETYAFYSTVRFQDHACFQEPADCYVREGLLGKGGIVAIAGLPPFSNGLIGRVDNAQLATRLAGATGRSAFSDYHLLESEKTFKDFLLDPAVALPFLGLLIGVFLFFIAGGGDFDEEVVRAKPKLSRQSFHSLNRQLLRAVMERDGGLAAAGLKQTWYIERLLGSSLTPRERETLEKIKKALDPGVKPLSDREAAPLLQRLLIFHQTWLRGRGRSR